MPRLKPGDAKAPLKSTTRDELGRKRAQSVKFMASTKTSTAAMADLLGISVTQLKKDFRVELKTGGEYVYAAISLRLVGAATNGDTRAMLEWMRQFGGWQQITRKELTGKDGAPISFNNLDSASLLAVVEALGAPGLIGGRAGRTRKTIESRTFDVDDMDAVPGPTDEGAE